MALALVGCGGTGSQPTTLDSNLNLSSVLAYPDGVTSSTSLEVVNGVVEKPLAEFTGGSDHGKLVVWGGRDATTKLVTSVHEGAYTSDRATKPIYIKYDENGGIKTVLDSDTGSYLTLSPLESSQNSITATGHTGQGEAVKEYTVRATYANSGVTVQEIDPTTGLPKNKAQSFSKTVLQASLAKTLLNSRGTPGDENDPLAGFTSVYKDADGEGTRTLILTAVFKAAAALLKDQKDFSKVINDTAGFLLLNQLESSYAAFYAKATPSLAPDATTSQPYRTDLPDPLVVPYPGP